MTKKFSEPPFWDNFIHEEPLCLSLIENVDIIKKESLRLRALCSYKIPGYGRFPNFKNVYVIDDKVDWSIAPFFGSRYDAHARRRASKLHLLMGDVGAVFTRLFCPNTHKLLKQSFKNGIVLNAYFTIATPGVHIKPHIHPITNGVHRMNVHLGLCCDSNATVTVGYETRTWEEGKLLAFKNSGPYRHSVDHRGTQDRIILIVEFDVEYLKHYGVYKGHQIKNY